MSVLEDIGKQVLGNVIAGASANGNGTGTSNGKPDWLSLAIGLLNQFGGLQGLMAKFQDAGIGSMVSSWISTGPNPPISAAQVKQVLGDDLPRVAEQAGTDTNSAAIGIAQVLPSLIDQLTPNGEPVQGDALRQGLKALLGGSFGKMLG